MESGKGNEPWYKSRRNWASIFSICMAIVWACVNLGWIPVNIVTQFGPVLGIVASYLGVQSWSSPK